MSSRRRTPFAQGLTKHAVREAVGVGFGCRGLRSHGWRVARQSAAGEPAVRQLPSSPPAPLACLLLLLLSSCWHSLSALRLLHRPHRLRSCIRSLEFSVPSSSQQEWRERSLESQKPSERASECVCVGVSRSHGSLASSLTPNTASESPVAIRVSMDQSASQPLVSSWDDGRQAAVSRGEGMPRA